MEVRLMKGVLVFLWVMSCFCSFGQRDSVISKTWTGVPGDYLKFNVGANGDMLYLGSVGFDAYHYTLSDSVIYLNDDRGGKIRYRYYGDSIVLFPDANLQSQFLRIPKDFNLPKEKREWKPMGRRVLYDSVTVYKGYAKFTKLSFSRRFYDCEIDSVGNMFLNARPNLAGLRGHYRGKMKPEDFERVCGLLEFAHLNYWPGLLTMFMNDGFPYPYEFTKNDSVYREHFWNIGSNRNQVFRFIDQVLKDQSWVFQNFVGGDSVKGMTLFDLTTEGEIVVTGEYLFLGSFVEDDTVYFLHKLEHFTIQEYFMDSTVSGEVMYFISDYRLPDSAISRIYLMSRHLWFTTKGNWRPEDVVFLELRNTIYYPSSDKLIIQKPWPFRLMPQTLFQRDRTSCKLCRKSSFQKAIEKYIIPDWNESQESD